MSAARRNEFAARPPVARSRVTNGVDMLAGIDGRSALARRYRDVAGALISDAGGHAECSEARLQLIRRFAGASVLAEALEARIARGEEIDVQEYSTLCSTTTRLAQRLGIERRKPEADDDTFQYARKVDPDPEPENAT